MIVLSVLAWVFIALTVMCAVAYAVMAVYDLRVSRRGDCRPGDRPAHKKGKRK